MYNIEKVIREFNDEKREVKFLTGIGNLTNDIEVRNVQRKEDGEEVSVVGGYGQSIAFNYWDKEAEEEKAVFFPIEAWRGVAERLGKVGKKGRELFVIGRLEERSYTSPKTGKTYIDEVLVIERFRVTSRGWGEENEEATTPVEPVDVEGFEEVEEIPF